MLLLTLQHSPMSEKHRIIECIISDELDETPLLFYQVSGSCDVLVHAPCLRELVSVLAGNLQIFYLLRPLIEIGPRRSEHTALDGHGNRSPAIASFHGNNFYNNMKGTYSA